MIRIRTHASAPETTIDGLGETIDGAGGEIVLTELRDLRRASASVDLLRLCIDEAFPGGSTLSLIREDNSLVELDDVPRVLLTLAENVEDDGSISLRDALISTDGRFVTTTDGCIVVRGEGR